MSRGGASASFRVSLFTSASPREPPPSPNAHGIPEMGLNQGSSSGIRSDHAQNRRARGGRGDSSSGFRVRHAPASARARTTWRMLPWIWRITKSVQSEAYGLKCVLSRCVLHSRSSVSPDPSGTIS